MSTEELTPQERACLVDAGVRSREFPSPGTTGAGHPPLSLSDDVRVSLTNIWRDFAMRWSEILTARLRTDAIVELCDLRAATYGDIIFGLERPTCFHVVRDPQVRGPFFVELPPRLTLPLVDRLFGGTTPATVQSPRELTEIEQQLVRRLTEQMLHQLTDAWIPILPLKLAIEQTASNPRVVRAAHPGDTFVVAALNLTIGNCTARLQIGTPDSLIESYRDQLAQPQCHTQEVPASDTGECEVEVILAEVAVADEDLLSLRVGDILMTDAAADQPVKVLVNERPMFWAEPGCHDGYKAVRIESQY